MDVAGGVLAGVGIVLLLHQTVLPFAHRRAALIYGREALVATLALIAAAATQWWPAVVLVLVAVGVAWFLGPWLALGIGPDAVVTAAERAAGMVRARWEPDASGARKVRIGGAATVRVLRVLPRVCLVVLTGRRTPKVRLWRNVFRKNVQNNTLRVA